MKKIESPETYQPSLARQEAATSAFRVLAGLWRELFPWEQVSHDSHFFELGADSLHVQALKARVRERFGIELPTHAVFENPRLSQMARAIAGSQSGPLRPALARHTTAPRPLSLNQQRFWQVFQQRADRPANRFSLAFHLTGRIDRPSLKAALGDIMQRHHILRSCIRMSDGEMTQEVCKTPTPQIAWLDLTNLSPTERLGESNRLVREEKQRPYDLDGGSLVRVSVIRQDKEQSLLLANMHGLVADERSFSILADELWSRYQAHLEGNPLVVNELPVQYADYVIWQNAFLDSDAMQSQLAYWIRKLAGQAPPPKLPADRARPKTLRFQGDSENFVIPEVVFRAMQRLGEGFTPFITLLTAFKILLLRYSGQSDISVVVGALNRPDKRLEPVIGLFQNRLIMRTDLSGGVTVSQLLERVRQTVSEALDHQEIPFPLLYKTLHENDSAGRYQALFEYRHGKVRIPEIPGLEVKEARAPLRPARFDLNLKLTPPGKGDKGIKGCLEYNARIFKKETIVRMVEHYRTLLADMVAVPEGRVDSLNLLTAREWKRILDNREVRQYPSEKCLHEVFQQWAARCPERIALVHGRTNQTWSELERNTNRLAWLLRERGLTPARIVAISLSSMVNYVQTLLAVFKTGGVCVPLPESLSNENKVAILEDAGAEFIVCDKDFGKLPGCTQIRWDGEQEALARMPREAPPFISRAGNRAYVLYTVAGDGEYMGVQLTHQGLIRTFEASRRQFAFGPGDVWTLCQEPDHEFAIWEMWGAWLHGGRLVVLDKEQTRFPHVFYEALRENRVTMLSQSAASLHALIAYENSLESLPALDLRFVIVGGEPLNLNYLKQWFRHHGGERPQLVYTYGPVECGIFTTMLPVFLEDAERETCLVGRRLDDMNLVLMDSLMQPVPTGVCGEICIGGIGLSRGYIGRPGRTAAYFVPNPLGIQPGERLFKSGDLARRKVDGILEYLGRADRRCLIGGVRVDPFQVERVLSAIPGVVKARVSLRQLYPNGNQMVAWLSGGTDLGADKGPDDLKAFLMRKLWPQHIPHHFVFVDRFPRTEKGAIDHHRLPGPSGNGHSSIPESPTEQSISRAWSDLLQVDRPAPTDHFFDLGGDPYLAIQLCRALRKSFSLNLPVDLALRAPTIKEQAHFIHLFHEETATQPERIFTPQELASEIEGLDLVGRSLILDQGHGAGKRYRIAYIIPKQLPARTGAPPASVREFSYTGMREDVDFMTASISSLTAHENTRHLIPGHGCMSHLPDCDRLLGMISALDCRSDDTREGFYYRSTTMHIPVQLYLYVAPDGVDGMKHGFYYHHPQHACLYKIGMEDKSRIAGFDNAFCLMLVSDSDAPPNMIEVGRVVSILEAWSRVFGVELHGFGNGEDEALPAGLDLAANQRLLYSTRGSLPTISRETAPVSEQDIINRVVKKLERSIPSHQMPDAWHVVEHLPEFGEDQPFKRKERFTEPENLEAFLLELFRETLGTRDLDALDDYHKLGLSSLKLIHALGRIQAESGKHIPIAEMFRAASVRELVQTVRSRQGADQSSLERAARRKILMKARVAKGRRSR